MAKTSAAIRKNPAAANKGTKTASAMSKCLIFCIAWNRRNVIQRPRQPCQPDANRANCMACLPVIMSFMIIIA